MSGPHQMIDAQDQREHFALELLDVLWDRYRRRVSHVNVYEQIVQDAGATFVNDHIAFRTIAAQQPATGIASVSRLFECLGYRPANCYRFANKHLNAIHYQHSNPQFPKLFVSELKTWELSGPARTAIERSLETHCEPLSVEMLAVLEHVEQCDTAARAEIMQRVVASLSELPWELPDRENVELVNQQSQYAAWVLVHGYNVNHFTSLVNSHGVSELADLEKTIDALFRAGVPMKAEIEGDPGSKLRQSATQAVVIDVDVTEDGIPTRMPWTYAYFELAERNEIRDPVTGEMVRFEGFLGPQATNLFEMTRSS